MHNADFKIKLVTQTIHSLGKVLEFAVKSGNVCQHYHYKHILQNRLRYINNIYVVFSAFCANTRGDEITVFFIAFTSQILIAYIIQYESSIRKQKLPLDEFF